MLLPHLAGEITLVDVALAGGVALVLPRALGGRWRTWLAVALCTLAACLAEPGSEVAVALTLPLGLAVAGAGVRALRRPAALRPWRWEADQLAASAAVAFAGVAWAGLVASCAAAHPFGIGDPFHELAAVHFTFVGGGAVPLAAAARAQGHDGRWRWVGDVALGLTVGAPPVVAVGFIADQSGLLVTGAVLMTAGVWCTGALELRAARATTRPASVRVLLALSGLSVVAPMVLATLWSAGQRWDVPALSIPAMVRTHGAGNAIGFVGAGLLALWLEGRRARTEERAVAWS